MGKVKNFMSLLACSLIFVVSGLLTPSIQFAEASQCPDTWANKLSNLTFQKYEGVSNGFSYQLWDSNYFAGWSEANPDLAVKVKTFGNDVYVTPRWNLESDSVLTGTNKFSNEVFRNDWFAPSESRGGPIPEWRLRYAGIGNQSSIYFSLVIEQKGCATKNLATNSFVFKDLGVPTLTLDSYFSLTEKMIGLFQGFEGYNFKQEEWIRGMLAKNISRLTSEVGLNEDYSLEVSAPRNLFQYGFFNWAILPEENSNCVEGFADSFPQFPPKTVRVSQLNCKAIVYLPVRIFELFKCLTPNCVLNTNLFNLGAKYPYLLRSGGDYAYSMVPVMKLEIKATNKAEATAAAELKAKQEAEAKAAAAKKTTITCVKGKLTKKVTAVKPVCPTGYKVKK